MNLDNITLPSPIKKDPAMSIIDSSKLSDFMTCPRYYFYAHILGWKSDRPNNHLIFGTSAHLALEHLLLNGYGNNSIITAYEIFLKDYRKTYPEDTDETFFPKTPERFRLALVAYAEEYKDDPKEFRVKKMGETPLTEIAGIVSINHEFDLHFRMDAVIEYLKDGKIEAIDHKTKGGTLSDSWSNSFTLTTQVGTYIHALNCWFQPSLINGFLINGIGLTQNKKKPPFVKFMRIPIKKTYHQMLQWQETTIYWMNLLKRNFEFLAKAKESHSVMPAFPQNPKSINDYFGSCPYFPFCKNWVNPLKEAHQPPFGFHIEHWNPNEKEAKVKIAL